MYVKYNTQNDVIDNVVDNESQEEKRRRLFAKRKNEDTAMSGTERYLLRKRTKLSQPTFQQMMINF